MEQNGHTSQQAQVSAGDGGVGRRDAAVDPFSWTVSPLRSANKGKVWTLPPAASLPKLPADSPGYGCAKMPTQPIGIPIFSSAATIPPGFLAPYYNPNDNSTVPVICPPTDYCISSKISGAFCMPQGRYEPMPCPSGFYCPNYKTVLVCTKGHYCLTGSVAPKKCMPFSDCPAGSVQQSHIGFLLLVLLFDIILCISLVVRKIIHLKKSNLPLSTLLPNFIQRFIGNQKSSVGNYTPASQTGPSESKPNSTPLVKAFKRGLMGQHDLTMNFSFDGMSLTLPTGKSILEGVTGEIRAGRMTAIMGPSGAGKTTFMSVLMGKVKRSGGDLLINGVPCEMEGLKKIIGFVPQEDIMLRELTVRENILHSARCRLPSDWTSEEVNEYVDNIIKVLNLTHVANSQIGDELTRGVSGGQRKRVNIGMELAAVPMSLFLDEPTSGLDATSALDVANVLKSISRMGTTIISIIHQPRVEIFDKFDDILMIAPGGRTAYLGPVQNAQPYFENLGFYFEPSANRADILMDIIAGRGVQGRGYRGPRYSVDEIVRLWAKRNSNPHYSPKSNGKHNVPYNNNNYDGGIKNMMKIAEQRGSSILKQMWYCHSRALIQQSRFMGSLGLELGVGMLAGGIMGVAALQDEMYSGVLISPFEFFTPSPRQWFVALYGLLIGISIALSAAPSAVKVFGEERAVYFREAASGHSKLAYFIGKVVSSLYRVFISSAHFTSILYYLARIPMDLPTLYLLLTLNFLVIYGVGHVISIIVSRKDAPLMAVVIGLFMGVFCGFGPSLTDAESSKIGIVLFDLGANRWFAEAFFGLWVNAYHGIYDFDSSALYYGYTSGKTGFNMCMMALLAVGYRVLAFVLMVFLQRDKQR